MKKKRVSKEKFELMLKARERNKCKCENCGSVFKMFFKADKVICHNCGHFVFRNKKAKFKYRLNERLKKKGRKDYVKSSCYSREINK